jgi:hypothetical protein
MRPVVRRFRTFADLDLRIVNVREHLALLRRFGNAVQVRTTGRTQRPIVSPLLSAKPRGARPAMDQCRHANAKNIAISGAVSGFATGTRGGATRRRTSGVFGESRGYCEEELKLNLD